MLDGILGLSVFQCSAKAPIQTQGRLEFHSAQHGLALSELSFDMVGSQCSWFARSAHCAQNFVVDIVGTVFAIIGVVFAIWSRQSLSNYWSGEVAIKEGQRLIHSGPYSIVRHPIYTGILFALLGTTLVAATVGSVLGFTLAMLSLWHKARAEEQFLMVEFRELYTNYQREVKFLIPFIY